MKARKINYKKQIQRIKMLFRDSIRCKRYFKGQNLTEENIKSIRPGWAHQIL